MKKRWGLVAPFLLSGAVAIGAVVVSPQAPVKNGIFCGIIIALAQSYLSTGACLWAWNKQFFYWVWGGGIFFRMVVFVITAYVVFRYSNLSLVATMVTMVSATTLFLVIESAAFFPKQT